MSCDSLVDHYLLFYSEKQLIKNALTNNDFLKNIDKNQVYQVVNCMTEERYKPGEFIVREHEGGNHFYVSAGIHAYAYAYAYAVTCCLYEHAPAKPIEKICLTLYAKFKRLSRKLLSKMY